MRYAFAAVILCVACDGPGDSDLPIHSGGGGGSGSAVDAGVVDSGSADAGLTVSGRVCIIEDVRTPTTCNRPAVEVDIAILGTTVSTTTDSAGNFEITVGDETSAAFLVAADHDVLRAAVQPDAISSTASGFIVPVLERSNFDQLITDLDAVAADGSATVVLSFTQNGFPLAGAAITGPPSGILGQIYYDVDSQLEFSVTDATASAGTAILTGLPVDAGQTVIQVSDNAGAIRNVTLPVTPNAVTFGRVEFPPVF